MALDDKTESATPERRREVRKKGQVAKSVEASSALVLLAGVLAVRFFAPVALGQLAATTSRLLGHLSAFDATPAGLQAFFLSATLDFFRAAAPVLGTVMLTGLIANVAQVGLGFSFQPLMPDWTRIDPLKGMARFFSARAAVELLKSLLKLAIIGYVIWAFLKGEQPAVLSVATMARDKAGRVAGDLLWRLCIRACSVLLVIAGIDYVYQRVQFEKTIRMTKQEVKEEMKRSEGDPVIKAQFRQRHRQLAMKRMMKDVPKADVVVTNPTHLAVALRYDGATMAAPTVVAKGKDLIAARIKQIAQDNGVPLVENKPVARALYAAAEIGDPVPVELYQAVAEILAFVYRLRHGARYRPA